MRYCHHCAAQFPDEHRRCLHCRGKLSNEPPSGLPSRAVTSSKPDAEPASGSEPDSELDFVLIARRQPIYAIPLLELLRAHDIPCSLVGDGGTRMVDPLQGSAGENASVSVYVERGHREAAEELLRRELGIAAVDGASLRAGSENCPACGERLTASTTECPDCGLHFPSD